MSSWLLFEILTGVEFITLNSSHRGWLVGWWWWQYVCIPREVRSYSLSYTLTTHITKGRRGGPAGGKHHEAVGKTPGRKVERKCESRKGELRSEGGRKEGGADETHRRLPRPTTLTLPSLPHLTPPPFSLHPSHSLAFHPRSTASPAH